MHAKNKLLLQLAAPLSKIVPISTKLKYCNSLKNITQWVYVTQVVLTITVKRFFLHKNIVFFIFTQVVNKSCIPPSKHNFSQKFKSKYFFLTNTIKTTTQNTAVFSTIAHLLFHNRWQFFSHFSHGDKVIHPIHSTVLSKQLV